MMVDKIQEHKKEAAAVTIAVLALLIFWFLFSSFSPSEKEEEPNEGGVEVQYGEPDMGGPDDSPITEMEETYTPPEEATEDNLVNQETSDVEMKTSETPKQKKKDPVKEPEKKKVDDDINTLNKNFKNKKTKPSEGEGDGKKKGTKGEKDGEGKDPDGGGSGGLTKGVGDGLIAGYALTGRSITGKPKLRDSYNSKGKVVVEILVNGKGQVVSATPGARGTTANDPKLLSIAKKLAYETKFSPLSSGKSQEGTISFNFGLK